MPSADRRCTYARVRGSLLIRTMAMVHNALSADLSLPRFNRCRIVFPDDACNGLTPHNAASAASLCNRSGLSPATASSMAAVCGPTPNCSRSLGACWLISWSSAPQDIHERLWKANPEQCTVLKGIPFKNGEPVQDNPPLPNWCRHTFNNIMHYVIARWTFISSH